MQLGWAHDHFPGSRRSVGASARPIDPGVRIGHVHLRTADVDRVRAFYVGVLGFDVVFEERGVPGWGTTGDVLFLAAGGYHHHLGFNTWKSAGGGPQPDGVAGLHHVAIAYPTRAALADAAARLRDAGVPLRQRTDHGTHLAIYLSDPDPDGNDLELMWDRPFDQWPVDGEGRLGFVDEELDVGRADRVRRAGVIAVLPDGMRMGPVRLAVADLDRATGFYRDVIGLVPTEEPGVCSATARSRWYGSSRSRARGRPGAARGSTTWRCSTRRAPSWRARRSGSRWRGRRSRARRTITPTRRSTWPIRTATDWSSRSTARAMYGRTCAAPTGTRADRIRWTSTRC